MRNELLRWSNKSKHTLLLYTLSFPMVHMFMPTWFHNMFPISSTISTPTAPRDFTDKGPKPKAAMPITGFTWIHQMKERKCIAQVFWTLETGDCPNCLWAPCRWSDRGGWQWHSGWPACYAHHLPNKPWHLGKFHKHRNSFKNSWPL